MGHFSIIERVQRRINGSLAFKLWGLQSQRCGHTRAAVAGAISQDGILVTLTEAEAQQLERENPSLRAVSAEDASRRTLGRPLRAVVFDNRVIGALLSEANRNERLLLEMTAILDLVQQHRLESSLREREIDARLLTLRETLEGSV